jgi:hypothetical protein
MTPLNPKVSLTPLNDFSGVNDTAEIRQKKFVVVEIPMIF